MLEPAIVAARLIQFFGAAVLFGTPAFLLYAVSKQQEENDDLGWAKPLLAASGAVLTIAALAGFLLQTVSMAGSVQDAFAPGTLSYVLTGTDFGRAAVIRAALALLATAFVLLFGSGRPALAVACALGTLAAGSLAWSGHGAGEDGAAGLVHITADLIHLWAAGVWIGALIALSILFGTASSPRQLQRLHIGLERFSGLGAAVVALLLATGLVNSWFLVGLDRWRILPGALYGQLLLLKVALVAVMVALAAGNRLRLTPRLGAALDRPEGQTAAIGALRASVIAETLLAVAVLAIVSILGVLTPTAAQ